MGEMMIRGKALIIAAMAAVLLAAPVVTRGARDNKQKAASTAPGKTFDPTSSYRKESIEGWQVFFNDQLVADKGLFPLVRKILSIHLFQITQAIPAGPLGKLRKVPIWP